MILWERADVCQRSAELGFALGLKLKARWDILLHLKGLIFASSFLVSRPRAFRTPPGVLGLLFSTSQQSLSDNSDLNVGGALSPSTARPHLLHCYETATNGSGLRSHAQTFNGETDCTWKLQRLTIVATECSNPDLPVIHLLIVGFSFFSENSSLPVIFPASLMVVQQINQM